MSSKNVLRLFNAVTVRRFASSNSKTNIPEERIVLSADGTTFIAWHPEKPFPYECTKPIDPKIEQESNTVLKTVLSPEIKQLFKKKTPEVARQELMAITHTTKHRWFPRSRDKRAKKTLPDREYL